MLGKPNLACNRRICEVRQEHRIHHARRSTGVVCSMRSSTSSPTQPCPTPMPANRSEPGSACPGCRASPARPPSGNHGHFDLLAARYKYLRTVTPAVIETLPPTGNSASPDVAALLDAVDVLRELNAAAARRLRGNCSCLAGYRQRPPVVVYSSKVVAIARNRPALPSTMRR